MFLVRGQTDRYPTVLIKIATDRAEREVGPSTLDEYHRPTWVIVDTGATHTTIPYNWLAPSVSNEYIGRFFIGYRLINEIREALEVADAMVQYRYRMQHKQITDTNYKKAADDLARREHEITDRCPQINEIGTLRTGGARIGAVKLKEIKISVCPKEGSPETITAPAVVAGKGGPILLGISTVGQLYMCWLKGGCFYLSREQYHSPLELCLCHFTVASGETSKLDSFKTDFGARPYDYLRLEPIDGGIKCSAIVEESMKDRYKERVERFCKKMNLNLQDWQISRVTKGFGP